jgi:ribosomal protein S18 acetylase RimI-like enzyme
MAAITCWSFDLSRQLKSPPPTTDITAWVKQAEKRNFPRNEAFNFDMELKKRNMELIVILDEILLPDPKALVGYLVFARNHRTAMLHKICVLDEYRRQGIARKMLKRQIEKLRSQNCERVLLWVDEMRNPAKSLYIGLGFKDVDRVEDYYASGRAGIQMILSLLPSG